jgi:hypothetical protein
MSMEFAFNHLCCGVSAKLILLCSTLQDLKQYKEVRILTPTQLSVELSF